MYIQATLKCKYTVSDIVMQTITDAPKIIIPMGDEAPYIKIIRKNKSDGRIVLYGSPEAVVKAVQKFNELSWEVEDVVLC